MSQVASDPKIHAAAQTFQRPTRPASSDRAPSPFESLLDDGTQAADQPAPTPPENKVAPADNSQSPAKPTDNKTAAAPDSSNASKSGDAAPIEKPDVNGKSIGDGKADVNAKAAAATGDGVDAAIDDDKPADGPKTDNQSLSKSADSTQTITVAGASALLPATTPGLGPAPTQLHIEQAAQSSELAAVISDGAPNLKALDANAPKSGVGKHADAGKQVDDEKQGDADSSTNEIMDDLQPAVKAAPQSHTDKPQFAASDSDSDKEHIAQARGEAPANSHRAEPGTPASASADTSLAAPKLTADATQSAIGNTTQTATTAAANPIAPAPPALPAVAVPLAGVAIEIAGKALAGKNRFEIRLDPPELGRIEVRLDVDRDGNVTSRLTVDRAETLDLLRRDASGLERALQDAGLKTTDNGLQFSLRDQSTNQQQTSSGSDTAQLVVKDEMLPSIDAIPQSYGRLAGQGGGLDIRV